MNITKKSINVFGSTGSIGIQSLELIKNFHNFFELNIISGGKNYKLLANQILEFKPRAILIKKEYLNKLKNLLPENKNIFAIEDFEFVLSNFHNFDLSIMGISGFDALQYCYKLIKYSQNKIIAIANKESIVCGGKIFLEEIRKHLVTLIPLDSEHNSIFQILNSRENPIEKSEIKRIIITASGGPFLNFTKKELENITPEEAIKNPNWAMGKKVSIDSATLMNKALELIEAHYFFDLPIDAIIHPQSSVHAIIEKYNGSRIEFISPPDMKTHIAHGLFHPNESLYKSDKKIPNILSFYEIKNHPFPFIDIAKKIIENKNHLGLLFNLAGEIAVEKFIENKIKFLEIKNIVEEILSKYSNYEEPKSIEEIINLDAVIRQKIQKTFL